MQKTPNLTAKRGSTLVQKWLSSLPRRTRDAVSGVIAAADSLDAPLYLVGGPVRDLLLGRPALDIDIVVEGDAIEVATRAALSLGVPVKCHPSFGTARIVLPSPGARRHAGGAGGDVAPALSATRSPPLTVIDLATARSETYPHPGALPRVTTPATVEHDLRRRDFTVNAMALRLNGPRRGEVLDLVGGRADLEARLISILHARSFQDDATRILRAARYAARFGFSIEPATLAALKRDRRRLDTISPARIHAELARILDEPAPEHALARLHALRALRAIHPKLRFGARQAAAMAGLRVRAGAPRPALWPLLAWPASEDDAWAIAGRIGLTRAQRQAVCAVPAARRAARALAQTNLSPSRAAAVLDPVPPATVWALATMSSGAVSDRLLDYLRRYRTTRPILRGDDLMALGVPKGPAVGEMLGRLRAAKLDGDVRTRKQEETLVRRLLNTDN